MSVQVNRELKMSKNVHIELMDYLVHAFRNRNTFQIERKKSREKERERERTVTSTSVY